MTLCVACAKLLEFCYATVLDMYERIIRCLPDTNYYKKNPN